NGKFTMYRKSRLWLVLMMTGASLVIAALVISLAPWQTKISLNDFRRIKNGMSRAEVEHCLGGPAGDYSDGTSKYSRDRFDGECWKGTGGAIEVLFDSKSRVTGACFYRDYPLTRMEEWRKRLGF